ncbi:MAG TPA: hypothetical protein PLG20_06695 [Candidatus Syntrophosphaera sp.]|nr:hypothetical protein [Candidatus Syntrophosphaera sp.]
MAWLSINDLMKQWGITRQAAVNKTVKLRLEQRQEEKIGGGYVNKNTGWMKTLQPLQPLQPYQPRDLATSSEGVENRLQAPQ